MNADPYFFINDSLLVLSLCHSEHREESVYLHFMFTDPSLRSG